LNTKTILILGGAGFIGSHLIDYILKYTQLNVISIGRGDVRQSDNRLVHFNSIISKDILYSKINNEVNILAIINCAGGGNVQSSHDEPLKDFYKTTCCTAEVLEYIRCCKPLAKFIQLSSAAVYGNCFKLPISINSDLKPISAYGYNNFLAENLVNFYASIYGISASIIRVFSVYGPGLKKQILWDACEKMKHGEASFFGTGQEVRDFVSVYDLVSMLYSLIQLSNSSVPIYNCGSGVGITIQELLTKLVPHFSDLDKLHFSGEPKIGDPIGYIADISLSPIKNSISIDDGIDEYVNWFKSER
tara:strand:- start:6306 stop:7214 length:909 start_codon:yes stop_codon:yes gene_type:complete